MPRTRLTIAALAASAAFLLTACSGSASSESAPETAAAETATAAPATTADAEAEAPAEGATALTAMVGTEADPEAFVIELLDASGQPVTTLPAGDYELTFVDRSESHNFRLSGPGGVDVATDVAGTDESTVSVTLVAGTYTYICDPHPSSMVGTIEVTA